MGNEIPVQVLNGEVTDELENWCAKRAEKGRIVPREYAYTVGCPDAVVTHDIADMMRKAGSIRIVCGIFERSEGYWT